MKKIVLEIGSFLLTTGITAMAISSFPYSLFICEIISELNQKLSTISGIVNPERENVIHSPAKEWITGFHGKFGWERLKDEYRKGVLSSGFFVLGIPLPEDYPHVFQVRKLFL